ncbi:cupin domain-containing protein [bacterium]|nr:cupin domain-containing protein [bacterium]
MAMMNLTKINASRSEHGAQGQALLAKGNTVAMRLWQDEQPGLDKPMSRRDYETVGYVLKGKAELHIEEQMLVLEPGDSWVVPRGAAHTYKILETFSAIEATSPPATQ